MVVYVFAFWFDPGSIACEAMAFGLWTSRRRCSRGGVDVFRYFAVFVLFLFILRRDMVGRAGSIQKYPFATIPGYME